MNSICCQGLDFLLFPSSLVCYLQVLTTARFLENRKYQINKPPEPAAAKEKSNRNKEAKKSQRKHPNSTPNEHTCNNSNF